MANSSNYNMQATSLKMLPALGTGILTVNGKRHATLKKHLNPMFTTFSVKEYISVFNDKSHQLVKVSCSVIFS